MEVASFIAGSWVEQDPVAAAEWAMNLPNGLWKKTSLVSIASGWVHVNPVEASEWAMRLPEGEARDKALLGIVRGWVNNKDQANAKPWVEGLQVSDKLKEELLQECPKR